MLKNRVAFVTGAARGMGKMFCLTLAQYGADIVAVDIDEEGALKTAEEVKALGRKAIAFKLDVTNKEQVNKAVDEAVKVFGRIDVLCNNAGIVNSSLLVDLDEKTWDKVMTVNAKGVFLVAQAVAKVMIKQKYGRIINMASQAAKVGEYANGAYSASKAAVSMITQVLGLELAEYNILVNCLAPGYIDTELLREALTTRAPKEGMTPEAYTQKLVNTVPMKRLAKPVEIAELVAFLASEKNSYLTGTQLYITGGKLMQ